MVNKVGAIDINMLQIVNDMMAYFTIPQIEFFITFK